MKKIISLFQRNYETDKRVRDEIVPGAEWVVAGEGIATRKFDGTCMMIRGGNLYKRFDAKHGKTPPPDFEPAQDYDEITGHMPGWIPVTDRPEDKWAREGLANLLKTQEGRVAPPDYYLDFGDLDGTYELCGPKVGSYPVNAEGFDRHLLIRHGCEIRKDVPRDFEGIKAYLADGEIEGIVWHHPDGRMVKIKAKDFGIKRRQ